MSKDVVRAFIAIDLPSDVLDALGEVIDKLKEQLRGAPIRWVEHAQIHLTLKFLGDVSLQNLEIIKKIVSTEASKRQILEMGVGGLGAFPKLHHPRVIWVGIEAPSELSDLRRGIEDSVVRLGYERDRYDFTPHLTLGRISRKASAKDVRKIGKVLHDFRVGYLGAARVEEIHVYRSDLRPQGAVYTRLFTAPLVEQDGQVIV